MENEDLLEEAPRPIPRHRVIWSFLALLLFPVAGYLLGWCKLEYGPRALVSYAAGNLLVAYTMWLVGLQVFLVLPVLHFVYPQLEKRGNAVTRALGLFLFVAPPLFSFIYFLAGQRNLLTWHEMSLMVLPGVLIASCFYEATRRWWLFSAYLSLSLFVPLYLVSDVMGPFFTFVNYFPRDVLFYALRAASLFTGVALASTALFPHRPGVPMLKIRRKAA